LSRVSGHAGSGKAAFLAGSKVGRDSLLEIRSPESARPVPPRAPETPEVVQAFISRHRSFFILLVVLIAQVILLSVQITRDRNMPLAKRWAVATMVPFGRSLRGLADLSGGTWEALRNLTQAEEQNRQLGARLAADEARIRDLSEDAAENRRLRSLLDFKTHLSYATVAAEVIGSSPGEGSNTVLIDKGADAGLNVDLGVVTPDGVAGKVIAVYPHSAQVLLITDPAAGAGGIVERSRAQGVLKGTGRGRCQLDYVMNEDAVSVGDVVLTSGLDRIFPKGMPLGKVVKTGSGNIYKDIEVTPSVELDRLEEVLVLVSKPAALQEAKSR